MNKQGITITKEGNRTTGIEQFFDELPDYIIPVQKCEPPYMPYTKGYGYMGVLLLDTDKDRVQCHICGRWYKALGKHITIHDIPCNDYKDMTGLYRKEPLMSLKTLYKFRVTNNKDRSMRNLEKGMTLLREGKLKEKSQELHGSSSVQWKNRFGTCDAQLKFRLEKAIEKYKRTPTQEEEPRLANVMARRFGNWTKAMEFYGYPVFYGGGNHTGRNLEEESKIAPSCKICGIKILRKEFENKIEDKIKWLNKKTCSEKCLGKYQASKITFKGCLIEGCKDHHKAKGFCLKHYLKEIKKERTH